MFLPDKEFRSNLCALLLLTRTRVPRPCSWHPAACRHTDGTISSACIEQAVRRVVSEDSDQVIAGLPMIHRFCNAGDLDQTARRPMLTRGHNGHAPLEALKVSSL